MGLIWQDSPVPLWFVSSNSWDKHSGSCVVDDPPVCLPTDKFASASSHESTGSASSAGGTILAILHMIVGFGVSSG